MNWCTYSIYNLRSKSVLGGIGFLLVLIIACGSSATSTLSPTSPPDTSPTEVASNDTTPAPTDGSASTEPAPSDNQTPSATATPQPTRPASSSGRDEVTVVTEAEPASVGGWSVGCSGEIHSMGCTDLTVDPIGWINSTTGEPELLSGFTGWEQLEPNRWRYTLREGVKFHNDEPWNGEAAKYGLDYNGSSPNGTGITYAGFHHGELVEGEPMQVDVVCDLACPIFPRTGIFAKFLAPQWYEGASEQERSENTYSFGPYRLLEWIPGRHTRFEMYEDYVPSDAYDSQMPTIPHITHIYRAESLIRNSMIETGEADWASDVGFDDMESLPQTRQSTTTEVYTLVLDLMWHPELRKKPIRQALAHAIDCQGLLDSLFGGRVDCHAAIAPSKSVGITPENSVPYEYDPDLAQQLLEEGGYDSNNEINVNTRPGSNIYGLEIMEAVVTMWRDVGVNSKLNSHGDLGIARTLQIAGCGQFNTEPGYREAMDCAERGPHESYPSSSHAYEIATSDEILDMQRQGQARMSCFGRSSRVCFPELEAKIAAASATPAGPERIRLMTEIADISHEEVYFIPFFEVQMVYGLSHDVEWQPNYSPRFRGNTMHFK